MSRLPLSCLAAILLAVPLAACGQKGPLVMPPPPATPAPATPAAPAAGPATPSDEPGAPAPQP